MYGKSLCHHTFFRHEIPNPLSPLRAQRDKSYPPQQKVYRVQSGRHQKISYETQQKRNRAE